MCSTCASTDRDAELRHRDVVRVDTEAHTLLDVGCKAAGLKRTLTFLLPGAPAGKKKREREGNGMMVVSEQTHTHRNSVI